MRLSPARPPRATRRAAVLTAVLALALTGCSETAPAHGAFRGLQLTPAKAKPSFQLTATDGKPFDFRPATDGRLTLLFFGYTSCPDVCPVHLSNIAAVLQKLEPKQREQIRVVFVTTDPDRDTPERIRTWLDNFDPAFIGLRGTQEEVHRVEAAIGIAPSYTVKDTTTTDYGVGHAAQVLAFTPDDSLRFMYPFGIRQQDWAEDLPRLLKVGGGR